MESSDRLSAHMDVERLKETAQGLPLSTNGGLRLTTHSGLNLVPSLPVTPPLPITKGK